jgi:hypothetical protein
LVPLKVDPQSFNLAGVPPLDLDRLPLALELLDLLGGRIVLSADSGGYREE